MIELGYEDENLLDAATYNVTDQGADSLDKEQKKKAIQRLATLCTRYPEKRDDLLDTVRSIRDSLDFNSDDRLWANIKLLEAGDNSVLDSVYAQLVVEKPWRKIERKLNDDRYSHLDPTLNYVLSALR